MVPHAARMLALVLVIGFSQLARAEITLQIDSPWNTSPGDNTGSVGTVPVTGTAALWRTAGFIDDHPSYTDTDRYGSLAASPGTTGDFFALTLANGAVDTLIITLGDTLVDPIFLIGDMDIPDATVTVTPGFTAFTNNADGVWVGNELTVLSGSVSMPETVGAHAAIQYSGAFAQGSTFSFEFDYSPTNFGPDNVLVGLYIPEPSTTALLFTGLILLAQVQRTRAPRTV